MSEESRRASDNLIIEMHGMIQRLDQRMDDTQRWVKSAHETHLISDATNFKTITDRLDPIESVFKVLKIMAWPAGIIATPTFAYVGYLVLEKIRH